MIISIANHKGGTGKTTTALNLASFLKHKGKKVLLVDCDPQANLSFSLGFENITYTIVDLMKGHPYEEIIYRKHGIDIIPSSNNLYAKEDDFFSIKNKYFLLKNALRKLNFYDYIIIDCPPTFSIYTLNVLCATQKVIIPMQFDVLSVKGLNQMIEVIKDVRNQANPEISILGIVGVNVIERRQLTNEIIDHVKNHIDVPLFNTYIRSNVRAAEAPSFGKSVIDYAPTSKSAIDYIAFGEEFLKKIKNSTYEKI